MKKNHKEVMQGISGLSNKVTKYHKAQMNILIDLGFLKECDEIVWGYASYLNQIADNDIAGALDTCKHFSQSSYTSSRFGPKRLLKMIKALKDAETLIGDLLNAMSLWFQAATANYFMQLWL
jgi:hypothetical protein